MTRARTSSGRVAMPDELATWVEAETGAAVVFAAPHFAGASRSAWQVDIETSAGTRPLFLLRDRNDGGGSGRDAGVLRALAGTDVPRAAVVAYDEGRRTLLLERLRGRSEFPIAGDDEANERVAGALMLVCARLHALDPKTLRIPHLALPECPAQTVEPALDAIRGAQRALGTRLDPFFDFALDWLAAHVPDRLERIALVHSDLGPGNFLHDGEHITGLVDWEVAHFGDPMEDLAALAVRDMATPVGPLEKRYREYAEAGGGPIDLARVRYFQLLVLVRNSAMIRMGIESGAADAAEMTMYETLLLRAAALVMCDAHAVARPAADASIPEDLPAPTSGGATAGLAASLARELEQAIEPALEDAALRRRAEGVRRGVMALAHAARVEARCEAADRRDMARALGFEGAGEPLDDAIRQALASSPADPATRAAFFARRAHRLAERRRPLMGDLMDRLPQSLFLASSLSRSGATEDLS